MSKKPKAAKPKPVQNEYSRMFSQNAQESVQNDDRGANRINRNNAAIPRINNFNSYPLVVFVSPLNYTIPIVRVLVITDNN